MSVSIKVPVLPEEARAKKMYTYTFKRQKQKHLHMYVIKLSLSIAAAFKLHSRGVFNNFTVSTGPTGQIRSVREEYQ